MTRARTFSEGRLRIAEPERRAVLDPEQREVAQRIIAKYPNPRSAALPLLFLVQSVDGYLTEDGMREVAELLDLTPADVLATASFYTMLKKRPQGEYLISVCRNISCTHRGARGVISAIEQHLGIEAGETTPDGTFSLEAAECLATCDGAPAMQVNYEDFYSVTPEEAVELVQKLARREEVLSVRGEAVRTAKEIAYETATAGVGVDGRSGTDAPARTVGGEAPPQDFAPSPDPTAVRPGEEGNGAAGA